MYALDALDSALQDPVFLSSRRCMNAVSTEQPFLNAGNSDGGTSGHYVLSVWAALVNHGDFIRSGRRKTVQHLQNPEEVSLVGGNKNYIFAYIVIIDIAALTVLQGANILNRGNAMGHSGNRRD